MPYKWALYVCLLVFVAETVVEEFGVGYSEYESPIVASSSDQRIILSVHQDALDRVFLVQLNGVGRSLYSWRRSGEQIELYQPIIRTSLGYEHRVAERYPYFISTNARPVVVASIDNVEVRGQRLVFDATSVFLGQSGKFPSPGSSNLGERAEIAGLRSVGVSNFDGGTEVWATVRVEGTNRRHFESWPHYAGDSLDLRAHWTIQFLREELLEPRQYDPRVGFDAANPQRVMPPSFAQEPIRRWRLDRPAEPERADDSSEKITVYLSADIPDEWKGPISRGLLSWGDAFEQAGLPNAIEVRDVPTDDPDFLINSGRYNVVEWISPRLSDVGRDNASMPVGIGIQSSYDFRSGEIVNFRIPVSWPADMFLNYFAVACGPALGVGLSTKEIKKQIAPLYLEAMVAHEFGHALGLVDGNFGEGVYRTRALRDERWLSEYGFTPSVMNYSRCNYVAQPQDQIDPRFLVPRVGPADVYSVKWGYGPHSDLDALVEEQKAKPYLRFTRFGGPRGLNTYNQAVDVSDPLAAAQLGLRNINRSTDRINGEIQSGSISDAEALLLQYVIIDVWATMLEHASIVIGGAQLYSNSSQMLLQPLMSDRRDQIVATVELILSNIAHSSCKPIFNALIAQPDSSHIEEFCLNMRVNIAASLLDPNRLNALLERDGGNWDVELLDGYLDQVLQAVFPELTGRSHDLVSREFGVRLAIAEKLRDLVSGSEYQYIQDKRSSFYRPSMTSRQGTLVSRPEVRALVQTKAAKLCEAIERSIERSGSLLVREHQRQLQVFCS